MKEDKKYLQRILEFFEKSKKFENTCDDFKEDGFNMDDNFVYHLQWLNDSGYVLRADGMSGIGYDNGVLSTSVPLRYTASGGKFLEELRKKLRE